MVRLIPWKMQAQPPATETNAAHWLKWAQDGYTTGRTTIEQFEQATNDALHGRYVNPDGTPRVVDNCQTEH
jgi:hypothetical protein